MKGLPNLDAHTPKDTITLPVSKNKITIKPFQVSVQKHLMIVKTSTELSDVVNVMIAVADECSSAPTANLAVADFEYLFLKIVKLSSGSEVRKGYICNNPVPNVSDDPEVPASGFHACGTDVIVTLDTENAVLVTEGYRNSFDIVNTPFSIQLRDITILDVGAVDKSNMVDVNNLLKSMVTSVVDTKSGVSYTEFTSEELDSFWNKLNPSILVEILEDFWEKTPSHRIVHKFVCPSCGHTEDIVLEGFHDFF